MMFFKCRNTQSATFHKMVKQVSEAHPELGASVRDRRREGGPAGRQAQKRDPSPSNRQELKVPPPIGSTWNHPCRISGNTAENHQAVGPSGS